MKTPRHDQILAQVLMHPRVDLIGSGAGPTYRVMIDGWQERVWVGRNEAMLALMRLSLDPEQVLPRVSPREIEVIGLVAAGLIVEEVAAELHVSVNTVRTHLARLRDRFGARNSVQLVAILKDGGVI